MKRLFPLLLLLLMLFAAPASAVNTDDLVIIHTNDVHAHLSGNTGYGMAAAVADDIRRNYTNVLLLDAGDALHGTPEATMYNGSSVVEIMNLMGYDALVCGNHDFDYGLDELKLRASEMQFPLLAANIFDAKTGAEVFSDHAVFPRGNYTVGVFGLATPATVTASAFGRTMPVPVTFAACDDLYAVAEKQVTELKAAGCNVIICLSHLGVNDYDAPSRSIDVAEHVDGIDVIVDGHSHTTLENGLRVGNTTIVSTGEYLEAVGVVTLFSNGSVSPRLVTSYPNGNETVDALARSFCDAVTELYGMVIGSTEVFLNGNRVPGVRTNETNFGDLIADAVYFSVEKSGYAPDAALINGGTIRTSIDAGDITLKELMEVAPFHDLICLIEVNGSVLREALEANTLLLPDASGGFPQVSHMNYTINTGVSADRVEISSIGGEPFDPEKLYQIATTEFIAQGGDAYTAFVPYYTGESTEKLLPAAIAEYIQERQNGSVSLEYVEPAGRIVIVNEPAATSSPVMVPAVLLSVLCAALLLRRR